MNDDVQAAIDNWSNAQRQLLDAWGRMLREGVDAMRVQLPPGADPSDSSTDEARAGANLSEGIASRFSGHQKTFQALMDLSIECWRAAFSPQHGSENWLEEMNAHARRWMDGTFGAALGALQAEIDGDELWRRYMATLQVLGIPMMGALEPSKRVLDDAFDDFGAAWRGSLQDGWDFLPRMVGDLSQAPTLGTANTAAYRKIIEGFNAWCACQTLSHEYQTLRAKAWTEVIHRAGRALAERAARGEAVQSLREWLLLWTGAGDEVLIEMYRSDEYLRVQRGLLAATMTYRICVREITDEILGAQNLPTRRELDDAYRVIQELRREVKALKKAVHLGNASKPPPARTRRKRKTPAAVRARKKTARKGSDS